MSRVQKIAKIPVQIYLEPEQNKLLVALAEQRGKTKAAIIRDCIDRLLESIPLGEDPALRLMKLGASGKTHVSERHDDYLVGLQT